MPLRPRLKKPRCLVPRASTPTPSSLLGSTPRVWGKRQSLIVIRHGWVVGEWDYVGTGPVNSCTKSLTGLVLAKLFELSDTGRLPKKIGYDDFAYKFLPASWSDSDPRKKLIKVRDLPTMCSGLEARDRGIRDLNMALSLPVVHPPETVDQYSSASVMLEGLVIENASGQGLKDFVRTYITKPIDAESVQLWDAYGAAGYAFMQTRDRTAVRIPHAPPRGLGQRKRPAAGRAAGLDCQVHAMAEVPDQCDGRSRQQHPLVDHGRSTESPPPHLARLVGQLVSRLAAFPAGGMVRGS